MSALPSGSTRGENEPECSDATNSGPENDAEEGEGVGPEGGQPVFHAESDELRSQAPGRCADASGSAGGENVFVCSSRIRRRLQHREPSPAVGDGGHLGNGGGLPNHSGLCNDGTVVPTPSRGCLYVGGGLLSGGAFGGPLALAAPRFERLRGPRGCGDGGGCRWCWWHAIWRPVRRLGGARRGCKG